MFEGNIEREYFSQIYWRINRNKFFGSEPFGVRKMFESLCVYNTAAIWHSVTLSCRRSRGLFLVYHRNNTAPDTFQLSSSISIVIRRFDGYKLDSLRPEVLYTWCFENRTCPTGSQCRFIFPELLLRIDLFVWQPSGSCRA